MTRRGGEATGSVGGCEARRRGDGQVGTFRQIARSCAQIVGGVTLNSYEKMGKIIAEYAAKIVNEKKEIESDECVSIVN